MTIIKMKKRKPAPEKIIKEQKEELAEMKMYIDALKDIVLKNNEPQKHK